MYPFLHHYKDPILSFLRPNIDFFSEEIAKKTVGKVGNNTSESKKILMTEEY